MGNLTRYLQDGFSRTCPVGWTSKAEVALLDTDLQSVLGFSPRADVLLERCDGTLRVWVEFEISRADPVANHAKFGAAHMFQPRLSNDVFLSMVSTHVARGRRNLGAAMTGVMRHAGIRAFQTVLLKDRSPEQVKILNHLEPGVLSREGPPVEPEIERAFAVCHEMPVTPELSVHFAGDTLDVLLNLARWNADMEIPEARVSWGTRRVRYFVHDPWSGLFAPSKFCAYIPVGSYIDDSRHSPSAPRGLMTVPTYCGIDGLTPAFDGNRAWRHLAGQLGFSAESLDARSDLHERFRIWHSRFADAVVVRSEGAVVLNPPVWFR